MVNIEQNRLFTGFIRLDNKIFNVRPTFYGFSTWLAELGGAAYIIFFAGKLSSKTLGRYLFMKNILSSLFMVKKTDEQHAFQTLNDKNKKDNPVNEFKLK